jgi:hypothetical protein
VTNQKLTINGASVGTVPDDSVTLNTGSSASTSFSGGKWTTTAGTGCGDIFIGGVIVQGPIAAGATFTWCGVFQSNTNFNGSTFTWSIGAACYPSPPLPTSVDNTLGVVASTQCPSTSLPAGMLDSIIYCSFALFCSYFLDFVVPDCFCIVFL